MAQGDAVVRTISLLSGTVALLSASAGTEVIWHNLGHTKSIRLGFTDGTVVGEFLTYPGEGFLSNYQMHVTNGSYYRVRELDGVSQTVTVDGIQSK